MQAANELGRVDPRGDRHRASDGVGELHGGLAVNPREDGKDAGEARKDARSSRGTSVERKRAHQRAEPRRHERATGDANQAEHLAPREVDVHHEADIAEGNREERDRKQP